LSRLTSLLPVASKGCSYRRAVRFLRLLRSSAAGVCRRSDVSRDRASRRRRSVLDMGPAEAATPGFIYAHSGADGRVSPDRRRTTGHPPRTCSAWPGGCTRRDGAIASAFPRCYPPRATCRFRRQGRPDCRCRRICQRACGESSGRLLGSAVAAGGGSHLNDGPVRRMRSAAIAASCVTLERISNAFCRLC
jgi:hypothetical protein